MASWKKIVADGASLTDIGTPANTDKVLIQDVTDGIIKYVDWSDITSGGGGINNLIEDTSPELGGHLITNGYTIRFSTNNIGMVGLTASTPTSYVSMIKVNTADQVEIGSSTAFVHLAPTYVDNLWHTTTNTNTSVNGSYGEGSEIVIVGTSTSTTEGRVYGMTAQGAWSVATPANESATKTFVGIAIGSSSSKGMLVKGFVVVPVANAIANTQTLNIGRPVYANTNGTITDEPPSTTGYFQRILGHAVASNIIYFNPSGQFLEVV